MFVSCSQTTLPLKYTSIKPKIDKKYINKAAYFTMHIANNNYYVDGNLSDLHKLKITIEKWHVFLDSARLHAFITFEKKVFLPKEVSDLLSKESVIIINCDQIK